MQPEPQNLEKNPESASESNESPAHQETNVEKP